MIKSKYIKPKSLTWWASVTPIFIGITVATEPLHGLHSLVQTCNGLDGGISPSVLINAGLAGIGLRGAIST